MMKTRKLIPLLLITAVLFTGCLYWDDGNAATAIFTFELIEEGAEKASFEVISMEKNITEFHVKTAQTTVGAALLELGIIEVEEDEELGFIVKVVDGLGAYDGSRWKLLINDEDTDYNILSINIVKESVYKLFLD